MKLEYTLDYNEETKELIFEVLSQDKRIIENFKFITSNGWHIFSVSCPNIRCYDKIVFIRGFHEQYNNLSLKLHNVPKFLYLEVKEALEELKAYEPVNKPLIFAI